MIDIDFDIFCIYSLETPLVLILYEVSISVIFRLEHYIQLDWGYPAAWNSESERYDLIRLYDDTQPSSGKGLCYATTLRS